MLAKLERIIGVMLEIIGVGFAFAEVVNEVYVHTAASVSHRVTDITNGYVILVLCALTVAAGIGFLWDAADRRKRKEN